MTDYTYKCVALDGRFRACKRAVGNWAGRWQLIEGRSVGVHGDRQVDMINDIFLLKDTEDEAYSWVDEIIEARS